MGTRRRAGRGTARAGVKHTYGTRVVLVRLRRNFFADAAGFGLAPRPHPGGQTGILYQTQIGAIMNEQDFQAKLTHLMQQLDGLPSPAREQLQAIASDTRDRHARMKKTVTELQDSLDYLRLSIKYLVFDLEATRRENQYLRKLLDAKNGTDHGNGDSHPDAGTDRA